MFIDLRKEGIYFLEIGWKLVGNWIDYAWDDVIDMIKKLTKAKNDPYDYSFIFYTQHRLFWAKRDSSLYLQHNILKKDKEIVIQIFKKHFKTKFNWSGSDKKH